MMKTIRLAWAEIGRHHQPLHRIALSFMLIVPTLYGALYLWSNWDPYGKLDQIPVAVVNEDVPVEVEGKHVDAGALVVENLKKDPIFLWEFTTAEIAAQGLEDGDYYLTITIPSDFSSRLASGAGTSPERAEIVMNRNDANGYVIGVMAETVQSKLHEQINSAATQAYFESVYGSLGTLRDGLTEADTGATSLRDGLAEAAPGARTLSDGLILASTGADTLAAGAAEVAGGTQQIADIVNPIADDVVPAIPTVVNGAAEVSSQVATATALVATGGESLATKSDNAKAALDAFIAANPDLANDQLVLDLQTAVTAVDGRVDEVSTVLTEVSTDAATVHTNATALQNAIPDMQNKVLDGKNKINELNSGAQQVSTGASELATKLVEARDGAGTLATGIETASTGSGELVTGLDQLVAGVPALDPEQQEKNAAILGNPTQVTLDIANPAGVYGRGLAPFFFSIALWVFGIVIFLVLRPTSGRALVSRAPSWRLALVGWLPILGIGLVGSYLLLGVSWFALGLNPVNVAGSVGVISLAVAVFTLLAHLARNALGLVGSAVLLVVLMLQLAASAGIYPAQTLPPALEAIHPYLPMTYLIEALRITFTGGSHAILVKDIIVLAGVGVAGFIGTWLVMAKKRTWTILDVHPPLAD